MWVLVTQFDKLKLVQPKCVLLNKSKPNQNYFRETTPIY